MYINQLAETIIAKPLMKRPLKSWRWLSKNLISTPINCILTLMSLAILWMAIPPILDWALFNADFVGQTRDDCQSGGACWVYVKVRISQFVYGFYPESEIWRVNSVFLVTGLILLGSSRTFKGKSLFLIFAILLAPILFGMVLRGGFFGLETVETSQWGGLFLTLVIAIVGIVASLPLGIFLALGRRSRLPVVRTLSIAFIELWRGVPLITVLFMASVMLPLFLPEGVTFDKLLRALVGVTLFSSAYMAEVIRGGLQAIPKGQYEAAKALGLNYVLSMSLIIIPQALKKVIPGIVNTFIGLFKDTTLVLIIGMFDLLGIVQAASTDPNWLGYATEGYVFAGLVFWVFCFGMSRVSMRIESKLQYAQD
jgi:general L-amino acid transport system permease protein